MGNPVHALYPLRRKGVKLSPGHTVTSAVIISRQDVQVRARDGLVAPEPGLLYVALVDRNGAWISHAFVSGLADDTLASSYNTTTQLLVVGSRPEAMARAAIRFREFGGSS